MSTRLDAAQHDAASPNEVPAEADPADPMFLGRTGVAPKDPGPLTQGQSGRGGSRGRGERGRSRGRSKGFRVPGPGASSSFALERVLRVGRNLVVLARGCDQHETHAVVTHRQSQRSKQNRRPK